MNPVNKYSEKPSSQPLRQVQTAKNAPTPASAPLISAKTALSVPKTSPLAAGIAAAGLPQDRLSASILSFARFFSLPVKPDLMASIRRQALLPSANKPDTVHRLTQISTDLLREKLSFAASAAESKGVELKERALEVYAEKSRPDGEDGAEADEAGTDEAGTDGQGRGKRDQARDNKEERGANDGEGRKTAPITSAALEKAAIESQEEDPLLEIMNRLPDREGRRWIVLPISFEENGREYAVSLRILLEKDSACFMAIDIAEGERRRLFVLEGANGKTAGISVYLQSEPSKKEKSSLEKELSALFGVNLERVRVKTSAECFPFEAEYGESLLCAVDEAV